MRRINLLSRLTRRKQRFPSLDIAVKGFNLLLSERTYIMGVLNITPDSFSEKGEFFESSRAIERASRMMEEGADIIDIGGESTRPSSTEVSIGEELDRVMPVIEQVTRLRKTVPISIDTRKAKVAEEAIKKGATIVNDISGLRHDPYMASVIAKSGAAVILMHMKGTPKDMQVNPVYKDLIKEIVSSFKASLRIAVKAGIDIKKTIIDPGIGFGKTLEHNLTILNRLNEFKQLGWPICIGPSRKSFIGKVLGLDDPKERVTGTMAACAIAIMNGANIIRVHDVREAVETARIIDSIKREEAI